MKYWSKPIPSYVAAVHCFLGQRSSETRKLIFSAVFGAIAAILIAMGGYMPGMGGLIGMAGAFPIILSTMISLRYGIMAYVLTIFLLLVLQPAEMLLFPFTTGLLGLVLGLSFCVMKKVFQLYITGMITLSGGIFVLLYGFQFPILGSSISSAIQYQNVLFIAVFSFFYSGLIVEVSLIGLKKLKGATARW
jgi:hypothetical protein